MLVRFERFPMSLGSFPLLNREVDTLFDAFLDSSVGRRREFPSMDLAEGKEDSILVAELPGAAREDVKISLHDGMLTISGERKLAGVPEGSNWLRRERAAGTFSRSIELPHEVNADAVTAELSNGVLRVVLPKAASARPREIAIR
jgi:HSP20 family protein